MVSGHRRLRIGGNPTRGLLLTLAVVLLASSCTNSNPRLAATPHGGGADTRASQINMPTPSSDTATTLARVAATSTTTPPTAAMGLPRVIWDCTMPPPSGQESGVEPSSIVVTCADNGTGIESIVWTSWTTTTATGSARLWQKSCVPDCARGGIGLYPAAVTLTAPVRTPKGLLFSRLNVTYMHTGPAGHTTDQFALPMPPE
jgi:hypothetical protein